MVRANRTAARLAQGVLVVPLMLGAGDMSAATLIARYSAAACVPPLASAQPRTRQWKSTLTLGDGSAVLVRGAEMAGGRVTVTDPRTGRVYIAANAGDYLYPADIRVNIRDGLLYVKAQGLAGGIWEQAWLFEYDLHAHRQIARSKVKPSALPVECSGP